MDGVNFEHFVYFKQNAFNKQLCYFYIHSFVKKMY